MKLSRSVKIVFIIFLLVRFLITAQKVLSSSPSLLLQVCFVLTMLKPSVVKFLEDEVLVMVSTEPRARGGRITVEPLTPPAITFCPKQEIL